MDIFVIRGNNVMMITELVWLNDLENMPKDGSDIIIFGTWQPFDILKGGEPCYVLISYGSLSSDADAEGEWLYSNSLMKFDFDKINVKFTQYAVLNKKS